MVKKEFTNEPAKGLSNLSDVELIEFLAKATFSDARVNTMKAILDYRLKKSLNHLKEITEKNIVAQEKYNKQIIKLTWALFAVAILSVIATFLQLTK